MQRLRPVGGSLRACRHGALAGRGNRTKHLYLLGEIDIQPLPRTGGEKPNISPDTCAPSKDCDTIPDDEG